MSGRPTVEVAMSDSTADGRVAQFLHDNPRMLGALFGLMVLLSQAGAVSANVCYSCYGP